MNHEEQRLKEAHDKKIPCRKWGPYLSERQWGTVREDCSESGDAWNYFTHDHARSGAYRWGWAAFLTGSFDCSHDLERANPKKIKW